MSVNRFKVALNAARFPLISSKGQRAVFVPGLDAAPRTPRIFMGSDESVDFDMSQIIYVENVMPISEGIHSVGFMQFIAPTVMEDFDQVFALRDDAENTVLYSPSAGKNYVYDDALAAWNSTDFLTIFGVAVDATSPNTVATAKISYAYVDGKTFVCYSRMLATAAQPASVTGTFDSVATVTLTVLFNGVTYTLGTSPELTAVVDDWTLDISGLTLAYGTYPIVATATDAVPTDIVTTTSLVYAATDASIMFWDPTTKTLVPAGALISDLPFAAGTIDGIASSNGYLLVWSDLTVAWAPFNGTAFNYSIYLLDSFTGAGYQIPEDVQGKIRAIIALPGGFIMFTTKNAIAASYHSQNIMAPWVFREISNAGGLDSYEQATVEGSMGSVIAYTTTGIQRISLNSSEESYPDISDFIAGRYIERYEFANQTLREASTSLDFYTKLTAIGNRYVVISYGTFPGIFSFALVYDLALKRWGKIRMVHRDCFYYSYGAITADLTYSMLGDVAYDNPLLTTYDATTGQSNALVAAQHGMAFLKQNGEVVIADWSNQVRTSEDQSVAIIGRVQLTRGSNVQLNRVEVDGLRSGRCYVQPSYSGRDLALAIPLAVVEQLDNGAIFGDMIDCKNFNLVVEGTFALSTIILEATTSGKH